MDNNPFAGDVPIVDEVPQIAPVTDTFAADDDDDGYGTVDLNQPLFDSNDNDSGWSSKPKPQTKKAVSSGNSSLDERERALAEREAKLKKREELLQKQLANSDTVVLGMAPNWPFKFYPILYHSIKDEIPAESQPICKKFYAAILLTWAALLINWLTWLVIWGHDILTKASGQALWATAYLCLGVPGAWRLWYRPIYNALKENASSTWCFFFLFFTGHTGFCGLMALGFPGVSGAGFIIMLDVFGKGFAGTGVMAVVSTAFWTMVCLLSIWLLRTAHSMWRGRGGQEQMDRDIETGLATAQAVNITQQAIGNTQL